MIENNDEVIWGAWEFYLTNKDELEFKDSIERILLY